MSTIGKMVEGVEHLAEHPQAVSKLATEAASALSGAARKVVHEIKGPTTDKIIGTAIENGDLPSGLYTYLNARHFPYLRSPVMTTVDRWGMVGKEVSLQETRSGRYVNKEVFVDSQRAGLLDERSTAASSFPFNLRTVDMTLTDGRQISLTDRSFEVITRWNREGLKPYPEKALVGNAGTVRISDHTTLTFAQAKELKAGSELVQEFPFQRVADFDGKTKMTNGIVSFSSDQTFAPHSFTLPNGLHKLPAETYAKFLDELEGQTASKLILPDWVKFDGLKQPTFAQDMLLNPRERAHFIKLPEIGKPAPLPALKGGKDVAVESVTVTKSHVRLSVAPRDGAFLEEKVVVDGKDVGIFDPKGGINRNQFPRDVETAHVKLADGTVETVSKDSLSVVKNWGAPLPGNVYAPTTEQIFSQEQLAIAPGRKLSFNQVVKLEPGTTVKRDIPFQPFGDKSITDGDKTFSRKVPVALGFERVPQEHWSEFIAGLEGKTPASAKLPPYVTLDAARNPVFAEKALLNERTSLPNTRFRDYSEVKPRTPPAILSQLKDGDGVTVTSVKVTENTLSLKLDPPKGDWLEHAVYNGDVRLGNFDRLGGIDRSEFPLSVKSVTVSLSDGRTLSSADRNLRVIDWLPPNQAGNYQPQYNKVFSARPSLVTPFQTMNMDQLAGLKQGTELIQRYPMQWVDMARPGAASPLRVMTNGIHTLPEVRPQGAEWRKYSIPAVREGYYPKYLEVLNGKFVDVLPSEKALLESTARTFKRQLSPDQMKIKSVVEKQMYTGSATTEPLTLSHGIVFKLPLKNGKELHIVENADDGAIYLFDNAEKAQSLASGALTRMDARKEGHPFVVHAGEWESRLEKLIREYSAKILAGKPGEQFKLL